MSITRNRELSQFGSFIYIDNNTENIGIATTSIPYVGIGTDNPISKFHIVGDTNLEGDVTISNGTLEASGYTLNGTPLIDATIAQWTFGSGDDIYRLQGNVGIGTSVLTQRLTVGGNISAGQFISTVTSGTAPFTVLSDTQVTNLNASFLRGKTPPSGVIVGTTDSQTLTNKTLNFATLVSPTLTSPIISSIFNGGTITLPTSTTTLVGTDTTDTLTNKTISAGSNTITGLTNSNLSGTAGITNANLANSTISGISLGSNLNSLTFGSYLTNTGSYNGSAERTVSVAATNVNSPNTIVARDISGDFTAGNIAVTNLTASQIVQANSFIGDGSQLSGVSAGLSITNDNETNGVYYPLLSQNTVGVATTSTVSTLKLSFNPSTGNFSATQFSSLSDATQKTNIKTIENPTQIVQSLRGVSFDWKETSNGSYGVIAQELEKVLPELVSDGEIKTVNYNGLVGVLIEAVKDLSLQIEELKKNK